MFLRIIALLKSLGVDKIDFRLYDNMLEVIIYDSLKGQNGAFVQTITIEMVQQIINEEFIISELINKFHKSYNG